ncbi:integrase, catalytic region, zinc finger, CCHC-type containing protein [Tanacetum coccineum]
MTLLNSRLTDKEKLQADCELKATNIVLHGLPPDVYALVNHHKISKDIWDRIKLLIQGQNVVGSGSQGNASGSRGNTSGPIKVVKCYNYQDGGNMARQCTQEKRRRDATWFKEKVLLVQAQAEGKEYDEEQLAFLADPRVVDGQISQIITHNADFQTDDLDAYDSDCDDNLMTSNNVYFIASFILEYSEGEVAETMAETMEQYMSKTRADYGSGVARPKIEYKDNFELKGQFLKELRTNTFSGSDHEDANEHIEIMDLFHIPNITIDQVMLRAFPMSLTRAASRWLRNKPSGSITTWEDLKTKFLSKYCPPTRAAKNMEEINKF